MNEASQDTPCSWYLAEEKRTENTLNHLRNMLGTFLAEKSTMYHFMEGYLWGIKAMWRKIEEQDPKRNK